MKNSSFITNSYFKIILLLILFNCIYFFYFTSLFFHFSVINIGNVNAIQSRNTSTIRLRKAMEEHGVVNDVIDTVPPHVVKVSN